MKLRKNKKGFSLVELMIVVVIMGILVAVAVPMYNALVEQSRRNVCEANQDTVVSCFSKWVLMGDGNNASTLFSTPEKSFNGSTQKAEAVLDPEFLNCFEKKGLPECPESGHYYIITRIDDETIEVKCMADGVPDEGHNPDAEGTE